MNQLRNTIAAALIVVAVIIGLVQPAHAVLTLTLESGGSTVSITDGGAGDLAFSQAGIIMYFGSVGVFTFNITTGISDIGSATPNLVMDLNTLNQSSDAGTLNITFQDTGLLFPTGEITFVSGIGGATLQSSLSYQLSIDGTEILSGGPLSGAFSETQTATLTAGSPYTMTLQTIIAATGPSNTSYNWQAQVPEPPTLLLFGAGLIGVAVWGRRRLKRRTDYNNG
jgi:hypothetical protein